MAEVWELYGELRSFGADAIRPSEIEAWARLTLRTLSVFECTVLARIHAAYLLSTDPARANYRSFARANDPAGMKQVVRGLGKQPAAKPRGDKPKLKLLPKSQP